MKRNVYESNIDVFYEYDKLRREQEFELLKDVCKHEFGIDRVWLDCFSIPIFNEDKEEVFSIQLLKNRDNFRVTIIFPNSNMLSAYSKRNGEYVDYVLTLYEVSKSIMKFIIRMSHFLDTEELFFADVTENENTKIFHETKESYNKLERGIY